MKETIYKAMLYVHKDGVSEEIFSNEIDLQMTEEELLYFAVKMSELNEGRPLLLDYKDCHDLMDDVEDAALEKYNEEVMDEWEKAVERAEDDEAERILEDQGDYAVVWDFEDKLWRDASKYMKPISVFVSAQEDDDTLEGPGIDVTISATLYFDLLMVAADYAVDEEDGLTLLAYLKLHNNELYEQWMTILSQAYQQTGIDGPATLPSEIILYSRPLSDEEELKYND